MRWVTREAMFGHRAAAAMLGVFVLVGCGGRSTSNESEPADAGDAGAPPTTLDARLGTDSEVDAGIGPTGEGGGGDATSQANGEDAAISEAAPPGPGAGGSGVCNFGTCPLGCCDSNGVCQSGSPIFCGTGGKVCAICPSGTECLYNDQCLCTATSCPNGCCDHQPGPLGPEGGAFPGPYCAEGTSDISCGTSGVTCADCTAQGQGGSCVKQECSFPSQCSCTYGCCDKLGQCQSGSSDTQCGASGPGGGGDYCTDCTAYGLRCDRQACTGAPDAGVCNAQTCPNGCCDENDQCQQGLTSTSCGTYGTNCQNCLPGGSCSNQQCITPGGLQLCDPQNCAGCCDATGRCRGGSDATQCGTLGTQCVDCTQLGGLCSFFGTCVGPDSGLANNMPPPPNMQPMLCSGCWDLAGACHPGMTDTQCGQGGWCADCTALNPPETCNLLASPRSCAGPQCPAPYPSCPAPLQGATPSRQRVCSAAELQNVASACAAGAFTAPCQAFLSSEALSNAACATCLQGFDFDFVDQTGILFCAAPYVDATCNHNSACVEDCLTSTCFGCSDRATTDQCETAAETGTCAAYVQADDCAAQALTGVAALCNAATYQSNFAGWLQAVGAAYCGP